MKYDLDVTCIGLLQKYFVFDKIFDLLDYDQNLELLEKELRLLKKETYADNYRFIFLHYDTDYYLYPNTPGVLITNLQRLLVELNIPNYFCIVVSNHNNLKKELLAVQQIYAKTDEPMSCFISQLQECHVTNFSNIKNIALNEKTIVSHYSCFNNTRRSHRHALISLLNANNLLTKGIVSYVK